MPVWIDRTPPEAWVQVDPSGAELQMLGRDALSGMVPGTIAPTTVAPWQPRPEDGHDSRDDRNNDDDHSIREVRTYHVVDLAGNTLDLTVAVIRQSHSVRATIRDLHYGTGPTVVLRDDDIEGQRDQDEKRVSLHQLVRIGARQQVEADYDVARNVTTIVADGAGREEDRDHQGQTKPGLVELRLTTNKGQLVIEY